ncbi:M23 family metallopeptidase [Agromyces cerinus]|uniref:Peptidase family M23 n=1 Tax=Agromyces cerinus subsp. cerinus TaxID=232089 RepID=A0A1N6DQ68_9MICO|nr:M23 family metallopeptidase [Agromyces cerinus]SIN72951.1 Peptidase family M23 [Agromyces cerinus subsp. cerinus]
MLQAPFTQAHLADRFGEWPDWRKAAGLGPHRGLDWNGLPAGTPIPAGGSGRVTWRTNLSDPEATELGHRIVIGYTLGSDTVYIGYSHLHRNPTLALGASVRAGDTVGLLGNSGTASTGAHLHQTASWQNGNPGTVIVFDPLEVQSFAGTALAGGSGTPIPLPTLEDSMTIIIKATADGTGDLAWIKKGMHFADSLTSPLVVLTAAEVGALEYWRMKGIPYRFGEWTPSDIRNLIAARGIHPIGGGAGRTNYDQTAF